MRRAALLSCFLVSIVPFVSSYSTGPPVHIIPGICSSLNPQPGHGQSTVAAGTPKPYGLYVNSTSVEQGQNVLVVLQGLPFGTTFRGFILQGRSDVTGETIGTWKNVPAGTQGLDCTSDTTASENSQLGRCDFGEACGNTWGHLDNSDKQVAIAVWTAPDSFTGEVYFTGTVVQGPSRSVYYLGLKSSDVQVRRLPEPTAAPTVEPTGCQDEFGNTIPEGVSVTSSTDPCLVCQCTNTVLSCSRSECPLTSRPPNAISCTPDFTKDPCCPEFIECIFAECTDTNGNTVEQGDTVSSSDDPCLLCVCDQGRLDCSIFVLCPAPENYENCEPITVEGECCPSYDRCVTECIDADGNPVGEGDTVPSPDNPCLLCVCDQGSLDCIIGLTCPAPENYENCEPIVVEGECCPTYDRCVMSKCTDAYGNTVGQGDTVPSPDNPCLLCVCDQGSLDCNIALSCPDPEYYEDCDPIDVEGECCPSYDHCVTECIDANGNPIGEGDTVPSPDDPCLLCVCDQGSLDCNIALSCPDPEYYEDCEPIYVEGECCPSYDHCVTGDCAEDEYTCKDQTCIPESYRCDYIKDCGDNTDESDCVCDLTYEFQCVEGGCVNTTWRCDGLADCNDGSDETDCEECPDDAYQCANGNCIPEIYRCDYVNDCEDKSDETDCVCDFTYEFACAAGGCVNDTWVCDGQADCADGSDEAEELCDQPGDCAEDEYTCKDQTCIPESYRCDYIKDCGDNTDESDCVCDLTYEFQCVEGGCVNTTWRCDGLADCNDGSDETDCEECPDNAYQCANGNCIPEIYRCDYVNDCEDKSDETDCVCDFTYEFACAAGGCVNDTWVCDGQADCADGSDEAEELCDQPEFCDRLHFQCPDGSCIPFYWVCDGIADCGLDGSDYADEKNCTGQCPSIRDYYQCVNGDCIPEMWLCDGIFDCKDYSDEEPLYTCEQKPDECAAGEYTCVNPEYQTCLANFEICDGVEDCADGADERDCHLRVCLDDEFRCTEYSDTVCIPMSWICDKESDCPDGSDELDCGLGECTYAEYECESPLDRTCISIAEVCNGVRDCADGADELKCGCEGESIPTDRCKLCECVDGELICATIDCPPPPVENCTPDYDNGECCPSYNCVPGPCTWAQLPCAHANGSQQCIPIVNVCNGIEDCADGVDELHCEVDECTWAQYECFNPQGDRHCISISEVCNGVEDCADGADERGCEFECTWAHFTCGGVDGMKCIPIQDRCNGVYDCPDGSDELGCTEECTWAQFECISLQEPKCIPLSERCNGVDNCANGFDEIGCPTECSWAQYTCENPVDDRKCISIAERCNGVPDCADGADEAGCSTESLQCRFCFYHNVWSGVEDKYRCLYNPESADLQTCDEYGSAPDGYTFRCSAVYYDNTLRDGSKEEGITRGCIAVEDSYASIESTSDIDEIIEIFNLEFDRLDKPQATATFCDTPHCNNEPQDLECFTCHFKEVNGAVDSESDDQCVYQPEQLPSVSCESEYGALPDRHMYRCFSSMYRTTTEQGVVRGCVAVPVGPYALIHSTTNNTVINEIFHPLEQPQHHKEENVEFCDVSRCNDNGIGLQCHSCYHSNTNLVPDQDSTHTFQQCTNYGETTELENCHENPLESDQIHRCFVYNWNHRDADGAINIGIKRGCVAVDQEKFGSLPKTTEIGVIEEIFGSQHDAGDTLTSEAEFCGWDGCNEGYLYDTGDCGDDDIICSDPRWSVCVTPDYVCDGITECYSGEDESEDKCGIQECEDTEYTCSSGGLFGKCIDKDFICDQFDDCLEGEDEEDCPPIECEDYEYLCPSGGFFGSCIDQSFVCDGYIDCLGGEEEEDCPPPVDCTTIVCPPPPTGIDTEYCPPITPENECCPNYDHCPPACTWAEFQCDQPLDKQCILITKVCNGVNDCADGADELGCETDCTTVVCPPPPSGIDTEYCPPITPENECCPNYDHCPPACTWAEFQCDQPLDRQCILITKVCNGVNDCADGADELDCETACTLAEFQCDQPLDRQCISIAEQCNGVNDCADGADELDCETDKIPPVVENCPNDLYKEVEFGNFASMSWDEPTANDNSGSVTSKQTHRPGSYFQVDVPTDVSYMFTDAFGNEATCVFTVYLSRPGTGGPCAKTPCENDGECIEILDDHPTGFECRCKPGFSGPTCEIVNNTGGPCDDSPCENDGVCIEILIDGQPTGFECSCLNGFSGPTCEIYENNDCTDPSTGSVVPDGSPVPSTNICEMCICNQGVVICASQTCAIPPGGEYCEPQDIDGQCCPSFANCLLCADSTGNPINNDQSLPTNDPCNLCSCADGEVKCVDVFCVVPEDLLLNCSPVEVAGQCCPSYEHCPDTGGNTGGEGNLVISNCPQDKTEEASAFTLFHEATWDIPTATSKDGSEVTVTVVPIRRPPTYFIVPSETTITYTFTDVSENEATCTFTYTITAPSDEE